MDHERAVQLKAAERYFLGELTGDDRAVIYGARLTVADRLRDEERAQTLARWGRRGHRAFVADMAEKKERHDAG